MKIFVVGSINMDLVINTDIMPNGGMTVAGSGFMTNPGGKGANQAVAVAKCGGNAHMVGCVGKEFGEQLANTLANYGVNIGGVKHLDDVSSGIAVIIVNEGDNRIILDAGANGKVDKTIVEQGLANAAVGDYMITQLEIPQDAVLHALENSKNKGVVTVLNPAPARPLSKQVLSLADFFTPNQSETEFYTGIYPDSLPKATQACQVLRQMGANNIIITMGCMGSVAFVGEQVFVAPAFPVKATDTTAAGDTFVGAFVTKLSGGATVEEAMTFANKAASITVTRKGAQQAIPTKEEIEK